MAAGDAPSGLWAVSCFFNPARWRVRATNYRSFRAQLNTPLVTVELSHDGAFELGPGDADVLIQRHCPDVMWQKERLLDIALSALPDTCEYVAWLDTDVIFPDPDWALATVEALAQQPIVQPFTRLFDLGPGVSDGRLVNWRGTRHRQSLAAMIARGCAPAEVFSRSGGSHATGYSVGHAWAARRDLLARHRFYDARILGSGNKLMAAAAFGPWREACAPYGMNAAEFAHFSAWAKPFSSEVAGCVGFVETELLHLWHGDPAARGLASRYQGLQAFSFDPYTDVIKDAGGCWRWNSDKQAMHTYVRDYFHKRREDSLPQSLA